MTSSGLARWRRKREIAEDFAARFKSTPIASDYVEGLLRERARIDAAIGAGEMSQADGRAFLSGESLAEMGIAPHIGSEVTKWGNETAAATAEMLPAAPDKPAAEPARRPPQPASAPSAAPAQPATPSAAEIQQEIERWESAIAA